MCFSYLTLGIYFPLFSYIKGTLYSVNWPKYVMLEYGNHPFMLWVIPDVFFSHHISLLNHRENLSNIIFLNLILLEYCSFYNVCVTLS